MPGFLRSLIVMLLGAAPFRDLSRAERRSRSDTRSRTRRYLARAIEHANEGAVEIEERSRDHARVPRFTWPGEAIIDTGTEQLVVPGSWTLDLEPDTAPRRYGSAGSRLDLGDPDAWLAQLTRLITLQVPGSRMRVTSMGRDGWETLEVRAPSRPETVLEFDRGALGKVLGDGAGVRLRVLG
jgi:hypothetical protein